MANKLKIIKTDSGNQIELPVNSIVNQRDGSPLKIWYGTQEQYNALTTIYEDVIYLVAENLTD